MKTVLRLALCHAYVAITVAAQPLWQDATGQDSRHEFKLVRDPSDEAAVLEIVARGEQLVVAHLDPRDIPDRDKYIHDLVAILQRCSQQDKFRKSGYELDEEKLGLAEPPPIRLKLRTVSRIIRLLGDLEAAEACSTLADFLTFPMDVRTSGIHQFGCQPTEWALFRIGDSALPMLRQRMASGGLSRPFTRGQSSTEERGRMVAAHLAATILGPRAHDELDGWIAQADTSAERDRLGSYRTLFHRVATNLQGKSLATYRSERLAAVRERLAVKLRPPLVVFPDEMEASTNTQRDCTDETKRQR